jgi:HAE1 family hydrophobic/amphiphilic exporter-1
VAQVKILGGTKREIQVLIDREKLKAREVSLSSVAGRIASNSQNVPLGKDTKAGKNMDFRTLGEYRDLDQVRKSAVNFFGSDNPVTVGDIAEVKDGLVETQSLAYLNGTPAIFLEVYRQSGANTVATVDKLFKAFDKLNADFKGQPGAPKLVLVRDNSKGTRWNLEDVKESIAIGILLTIVVVYFFLGSGRSTIITVAALPNSLLGAFILMYWQGFTINVITLMALSLSVGLLIDDAIVVRENIWRHMELGKDPKLAAVEGTREVTMAVIATSSTVIAVFLPMAFLTGIIGQFFKSLGWTVVFAMLVSLFDAMTMAPLLSAYLAVKGGAAAERLHSSHWALWNPMRYLRASVEAFERGMTWLRDAYTRLMHWALDHKAVVALTALALFILSLAAAGKLIKFEFMPAQDIGFFQVNIEGAPDTALEATQAVATEIQAKLKAHKEVSLVATTVGNDMNEYQKAQFYIELVNYKQRKGITTTDMKALVRRELGAYKDWNPRVGDVNLFGDYSPFTLLLSGDDLDKLAQASEQVMSTLKQKVPGLVDLDSSYRPGKPEIQVVMDPNRMKRLGVNGVTAGQELRGQVDGTVAAQFREGDLDYDIRVRLKEDQRDLRQGLQHFWVPNMNQNLVRLSDIAQSHPASGPLSISRRDRKRQVTISAEIGKGYALGNVQEAAKKVMAGLKLPQGVGYSFIGQAEDMKDMFVSMVVAMGLAVLLIFLILASLYESITLPFLIMTALPLAIVGALGALMAMNQSLNMFSMIGLIMLLGLVAKNSILLVDYTIHLTRRGMSRREAVIEAGRVRLRPILMTTIALIAGMLPMALALSEVSRFRQSMGVAIVGGLLSSTALTLIVVPAFYEWFDDFRLWTRRLLGRPELREIDIQERAEIEAEKGLAQAAPKAKPRKKA